MSRMNFSGRRTERREAAEVRQSERDARTPQQQLARLDKYGFAAIKERARLHAEISGPVKSKKEAPAAEVAEGEEAPKLKAKERRAEAKKKSRNRE